MRKGVNKSPGSIAYILEQMKIVERRQLSRGYFDYIFSDLYDKHKRTNKKQNKIQENKDVIQKSDLTKEELRSIKVRINKILI